MELFLRYAMQYKTTAPKKVRPQIKELPSDDSIVLRTDDMCISSTRTVHVNEIGTLPADDVNEIDGFVMVEKFVGEEDT